MSNPQSTTDTEQFILNKVFNPGYDTLDTTLWAETTQGSAAAQLTATASGSKVSLDVNVVSGGSAGGDGAILDGVSSSIKATVLDLTSSNPLTTVIVDANGDQISSFGGGTQYTEDAAAAANPIGTALNLIRADALAGVTTTDGDNLAARGTDKGELYVKHVDAIPVTQSGTWDEVGINDSGNSITVDGTVTVNVISGFATAAAQTDKSQFTKITDGTDTLLISAGGAALVDGSATTQPVSATDLDIRNLVNTDVVTAELSAVDNAVLDVIAAKDFATQTTLAAINAKLVSGTDIGDVTINNATIAVTQSGTWDEIGINDSGNSITVDGTVAVTGVATEVTLASLLTSSQLMDDTIVTLGTDTYTEATTKGQTIGAVRRDADTTLVGTTNEIGPLQMNALGQLKVEVFSGETLPVSLASTTVTGTVAVTQSGTWDEVGINDSGNVITVDGSGSAGTAATGVVTVQGIASMTPILATVTGAVTTSGTVTEASAAAILTSTQLIDDTVFVDDTATHSTGSTKVLGIGAVAVPTDVVISANDIGMPAMSVDRRLYAANAVYSGSAIVETGIYNATQSVQAVGISAWSTGANSFESQGTETNASAVVGKPRLVAGWNGTNAYTLKTDTSGQLLLGATTNAIGKLAANSGVDIGDVDILSIAAGNNNIGDVDIASLPNEGQQTMANSISVAIASNQTAVPVTSTPGITGIGHGVKTVTTAGTDVALATTTACKRVTIQAQLDNTSGIAVGASGVDATVATGTGVFLNPGDVFELEIDDLADVFIDSLVSGEGVRYTYFT